MRIGLLRPTWVAGGAETYLLQLGSCLRGLGHEVRFLSTETAVPHGALRVLGNEALADSFDLVPADSRAVSAASRQYDLFVNAASDWLIAGRATRNWLVVFAPRRRSTGRRRAGQRLTAAARRALALPPNQRLVRGLSERLRLHPDVTEGEALKSYERLIGVSRYVATVVEREYRRPCSVLYPAVEAVQPDVPKDLLIATVGRFSPWGNAKRHDVLVEAAAMVADRMPGIRFCFLGSVPPDAASAAYLDTLKSNGSTTAIQFILDAAPDDLHGVLARSVLYWHAAGFGVNPLVDFRLVEQFGISIVEAMAHGAVPCVVPVAGPAEIVSDGVDGAYWADIEELVDRTVNLLERPDELAAIAAAARRRARYFDHERMDKTVRLLLNDAGCE